MSNWTQTTVVSDSSAIVEIGARIAASGRFAMDLEFMSADRYIPELALVQVAWKEGRELQIAVIDGVGTNLTAIFEQVESPSVLMVAHGAKQDLALLATCYQIRADAFVDTQIAAAFAGISEQIGYANLVSKMMDIPFDKGPQTSDWMRRPLSEQQLEYAHNDVRYLLAVWDRIKAILDRCQRLEWVKEESAALAKIAAERPSYEDAYKKISAARNLKGSALGALRELACWREQVAVEGNTPPSWIISDAAAIEVCRRNIKTERDFKKVKGLGGNTFNKYGASILEAIENGRHKPVSDSGCFLQLNPARQAQAAVVTAMVACRAADIGISPRVIAAKADAEALVRYSLALSSPMHSETKCKLLRGWRAETVGTLALHWLQGNASIIADSTQGLRAVATTVSKI